MKNPRPLRALALYLAIGVPLAASCAREESTLDPSGAGNGGTRSGAAGSSGGAGSKATAGSSSAFGGTNGNAGNGAAGKGGTAGAAAQAGAGEAGGESAAGAGGSGGSVGIPPDVLENASVIVYYQDQSSAAAGIIKLRLQLQNQSDDPLPLASVKIRYWFTAEVTPSLHQYYTGPDVVGPMVAFVDDGENSHALFTFTGGTIAKGADRSRSEVQLQVDPATFQQADDFSYDAKATMLTPNAKVTLYLADQLVWGCEPSGSCAGGETGAGGAGGVGEGGGAGDASVSGGAPGSAGQAAGGAP